jgi:uncharacterized membrane protein YebE (DUF533 family)
MSDSHKHKEAEKAGKQAAEARGEAKAMTVVGVAGAGAWGLAEFCMIVGDSTQLAADLGNTKISKETWKKLGIVAGAAAIGALIYAGIKHQHAHDLEAKHKEAGDDDWKTRIEKERAAAKEALVEI